MKAQVEFGAGMIEGYAGNLAAAARHLRESNRLFSELGLTLFVDTTRSELAHLLRRHGDLEGALAHYRETIRAWQTSGSVLPVAHMLESFAYLSVAKGQPERAARLLGAGTALREPTGIDMLPHERAEYDGAIEALRSALGVDLFSATFAAGRTLDMNAAVAYAVE